MGSAEFKWLYKCLRGATYVAQCGDAMLGES